MDTETDTKGKHHMGMKAEMGMMHLSQDIAKKSSKPPETSGEASDRFFLTTLRRFNPANTLILDFQPPEL